MWSIEPDGEIERTIFVGFEQPNGLTGPNAIGLIGVVPLSRQPAEYRTKSSNSAGISLQGKNLLFNVLIFSTGVENLFPRDRVIQAIGANLTRYAIVVQLPNTGSEITRLAKC